MAGIRAVAFAALGTSIFMMFLILGVGGFATSNSVPLPANLSNQYQIYSSNNVYSGNSTLRGISPLLAKASADKNLTQNQTFISGTASGIAVASGLVPAILGMWNDYANFVGEGLTIVGISPTYEQEVAVVMIIVLVVLTIVSALFLFPV
jgi:hypothetical protein